MDDLLPWQRAFVEAWERSGRSAHICIMVPRAYGRDALLELIEERLGESENPDNGMICTRAGPECPDSRT